MKLFNKQILKDDTDRALTYNIINVPEYLFIAEYYKNYEQNRKDVKVLNDFISNVYALSVSFLLTKDESYKIKGITLIKKWITINKGYKNIEANLYFVYKWHNIIQACENFQYRNYDIVNYIQNIYLPACENISTRINNYGIWGLFGIYISNKFLRFNNDKTLKQIKSHIRIASIHIPFISNKNELWTENLRSTSGMEYTYFYLAPTLYILNDCKDSELYKILDSIIDNFFYYCNNIDKWPYKEWKIRFFNISDVSFGILRKIQKMLFPCEDVLLKPSKENWAGNFFHVAGIIFNKEEYVEWSGNNITSSVNIFKYYI